MEDKRIFTAIPDNGTVSDFSEPGMRSGIVLQSMVRGLRRFARADRGNIAMIFGLALIPICLAIGVGLDMSRAMITRARLGAALDAAGLAVGSQPSLSQDQMQSLARQYFKQNYTADPNQYGQPADVVLTRPTGSQTITLTTSVAMPTILMRIVGIDTMSVTASSQITWGQTKLWVALVLDNTGSMCEPDRQPCPTPSSSSKIYALKEATHNLLQMLQNAAANDGDVKVSIVPFSKDVNVGTDKVSDAWIDWTDWEAPPPNSAPDSSVGPGSSCPYGSYTSPYGYGCMAGPANSGTSVSKVPGYALPYDSSKSYSSGDQVSYNGNIYIFVYSSSSSGKTPGSSSCGYRSSSVCWQQQDADYAGYICPGTDNGRYNDGNGSSVLDAAAHHYNGCYDSVPTKTLTTTDVTPTTLSTAVSCTSDSNGNCTGSKTTRTSTSVGSTTETTSTSSGYSGNSTSSSTSVGAPTTGNPVTTRSGSRWSGYTYTTTVTTTQVTTTTTVTKTGTGPYSHTWHANDHSTWDGCIMDRAQDDDTKNTAPTGSAKFPAENTDYCLPGTITPLGYDWSTLSSQVDAMTANGNTNQTVGLAWGWQTLTNSDPYNPGEVPTDTRKVLILLTDGLNTQNRWSESQDTIDDRTSDICANIKDDNITVYTVQVNTGGDPTSSILQDCASDTSKFFELTEADQIVNTFQQIGTQITNLRVSL